MASRARNEYPRELEICQGLLFPPYVRQAVCERKPEQQNTMPSKSTTILLAREKDTKNTLKFTGVQTKGEAPIAGKGSAIVWILLKNPQFSLENGPILAKSFPATFRQATGLPTRFQRHPGGQCGDHSHSSERGGFQQNQYGSFCSTFRACLRSNPLARPAESTCAVGRLRSSRRPGACARRWL